MGATLMQDLARRDRWAPGREARDVELVQETRGAEPPLPRRRQRGVVLPVFSLLLFTSLLYATWELISLAQVVPDFILPTPLQVAQDFGLELSRGGLLANAGVTLQEALGGFALAAAAAGVLGYAIAHLRPLEVLVAPFIHPAQGLFRDWDDFASAGVALSMIAAWLVGESLRDARRHAWLGVAVTLGVGTFLRLAVSVRRVRGRLMACLRSFAPVSRST